MMTEELRAQWLALREIRLNTPEKFDQALRRWMRAFNAHKYETDAQYRAAIDAYHQLRATHNE